MTTLHRLITRIRHCCAVFLLGSLAGQAVAEDVLTLAPGQTRLSFSVLGLETLGAGDQLAVELDGYDVSALISRTDSDFLLDMPSPLADGSHPLLVLVFYANGNVATLLEASVEVTAGSAAPASDEMAAAPDQEMDTTEVLAAEPASAEAATSVDGYAEDAAPLAHRYTLYGLLSNNYRVDEKDAANYPDSPRYASNGGVSYRGEGAGADWQWQGELDALYDNLSENNPNGYDGNCPTTAWPPRAAPV